MNELGVGAWLLITGASFPLAFGMARVCLAGVMRVIESSHQTPVR
jgi:hypothetical protein